MCSPIGVAIMGGGLLPLPRKHRESIAKIRRKDKIGYIAWAPGGGGTRERPPPKSEKIVVENWCYFPRLYL